MNWNQTRNTEDLNACLDETIKKTRVHGFQIRVLDREGNPLPDIRVRAVHKNHDFIFGVCLNGHISMTNALACGEGSEAETYWKRIGDLFNGTTLWWGWRVLEPERGRWTFDEEVNGYGPMERMLGRAEQLGHAITAHAILYPRADVSPAWLASCTAEEAIHELEVHVKTTVERYRNRISCWHPVNEAYDEIQNVESLRVNEGLVYRWISDLAPHACIVDNGGNTIQPEFYQKGIENAERFGGRVNALGIRGYFELYDCEALPFYENIWKHFDDLANRYHRRIRFTEIGAVSAPRKDAYSPWDVDPTTAGLLGISNFDEFRRDQPITEETQARFLVLMYKMAFAHPAVDECTYWDLCDSYTWNQVEGGLIRADLSPKPAYEQLEELIRHTWSTRADLRTNADGSCEFEGFDGMYEVEAQGKKTFLHFNAEKNKNIICI